MLRVLTYHRVADPESTPHLDPALVSARPEAFRRQMEHLRRWYHPVSLGDIERAFGDGTPLPKRAVHVTVDDAYRDFAEFAWPILVDLEIPVTVFVPTAFPGADTRSFWWDRLHRAYARGLNGAWEGRVYSAVRRRSIPGLPDDLAHFDARDGLRQLPHDRLEYLVDEACREAGVPGPETLEVAPMLDWDELRELRDRGVTFGAHTHNHVALSRVGERRVRGEVRRSLDVLERELGVRPTAIAYPYGICDRRVAQIAREEGLTLGFTCEDGLNSPEAVDPLRLRRTNITPRTTPRTFKLRMLPWFSHVDRWRHRHERAVQTA